MATLEDRLTLAAFNAATEGRGNTKLVWGSYEGTGEYGRNHPTSLTFDEKPLWIRIWPKGVSSDTYVEITYGCGNFSSSAYTGSSGVFVTWNGNDPSWYVTNDIGGNQLNMINTTYYYIALLGL